MNINSRILAIGTCLFLIFLIFEFIRRGKLKEKYAIIWFFSGVIMLIFAVFENFLDYISRFFGIVLPINTVFFFGIFFIIVINLHFTLIISNLTEQNKKLVQKIALLEEKIK